jgi:hypothetical protein
MRRALLGMTLAIAACNIQKEVKLTFGDTGEGLDGFMCKDSAGQPLLDRLAEPDGGVLTASLVTDFVSLGGLPDGCRTGQLIKWCSGHTCAPVATTRKCTEIVLPTRVKDLPRAEVRRLILDKLKTLKENIVSENAPDGPVMLRVLATAQPCSAVMVADGKLPAYDKPSLVGCAYSCPTLFDQVGQDVFLGFETLTDQCEQGVRTCSDNELHWQP